MFAYGLHNFLLVSASRHLHMVKSSNKLALVFGIDFLDTGTSVHAVISGRLSDHATASLQVQISWHLQSIMLQDIHLTAALNFTILIKHLMYFSTCCKNTVSKTKSTLIWSSILDLLWRIFHFDFKFETPKSLAFHGLLISSSISTTLLLLFGGSLIPSSKYHECISE